MLLTIIFFTNKGKVQFAIQQQQQQGHNLSYQQPHASLVNRQNLQHQQPSISPSPYQSSPASVGVPPARVLSQISQNPNNPNNNPNQQIITQVSSPHPTPSGTPTNSALFNNDPSNSNISSDNTAWQQQQSSQFQNTMLVNRINTPINVGSPLTNNNNNNNTSSPSPGILLP